MNIQSCSSCCQLGGIVRYSSYSLYLYHPNSWQLERGQWICKNSMWSWVMGNYKLDVQRPSLDRAQVSNSRRSVFIHVLAFDLLGNPEEREIIFSVFFPYLQKGNTVSQSPVKSGMRCTDETNTKQNSWVSIKAFPSKWHNYDCVDDQIKKLSWQFLKSCMAKRKAN